MVKRIPTDNAEKSRRLIMESLLIQKRFSFLNTRMVGDRLVCRGSVRPTETSAAYRVELVYKPWNSPEVRILDPEINPEGKLHFYKNGTLCLYDWREQPWQKKWHLADTVIPWTAEWVMYYELYLLTGKWLGASAVHTAPKAEEPKPDSQTTEQERVE
jgi:hypothetical protein